MNSPGFTDLEPFETDLCEEFETSDLEDGDLGIMADLAEAASALCFLVGESPLLKVKVLLRGRSRFDDSVDLDVCECAVSSIDPSFVLADRVNVGLLASFPFVAPIVE